MTSNETTRRPLSPQQDHVLRSLCLFTVRYRRQPSLAQLADLCGVTTVQRQIEVLEAKGWIGRSGGARAIEIPQDVFDAAVSGKDLPLEHVAERKARGKAKV